MGFRVLGIHWGYIGRMEMNRAPTTTMGYLSFGL